MKRDELIEVAGYLISITPRTRRGLMEYRLKIMSLGGGFMSAYLHEPKIPLRPGLRVKVKAFLSRQLGSPRWVIEKIEPIKDEKDLEPEPTLVEEVVRGAYPIVCGKRDDKAFSMPAEEEVLSKIPSNLPQRLYCIFAEGGSQLKIVEALSEKEYEVFKKTLSMLLEIDRDSLESEKIVMKYLKEVELPRLP
ncbi:MAG TPA: hypothetical protein ENF79_01780 [Nitrososphaeria archaeon]|nr:hypothetical protein [Nitrososphaeria archaeon]